MATISFRSIPDVARRETPATTPPAPAVREVAVGDADTLAGARALRVGDVVTLRHGGRSARVKLLGKRQAWLKFWGVQQWQVVPLADLVLVAGAGEGGDA